METVLFVLVLIFNPVMNGEGVRVSDIGPLDPREGTHQLVDLIEETTGQEVHTILIEVDGFPPGFTGTAEEYFECRTASWDACFFGTLDQAALLEDYFPVRETSIDEIWVWTSQGMVDGNPEFQWIVEEDEEPIFMMGLNYQRHYDLAWHTFLHSVEDRIGWQDSRLLEFSENCGNTHFPPNTEYIPYNEGGYNTGYDYNSENVVTFVCNGIEYTTDASLWNYSSADFYRWWMNELPEEIWRYRFGFDDSLIVKHMSTSLGAVKQ